MHDKNLQNSTLLLARLDNMKASGFAKDWLASLVAMPTQSQLPDQDEVLRDYLSKGIAPLLDEIGFDQKIYANPIKNAPPLLVAHRHENDVLPTILIYGHGDVIHAQYEGWHEGLQPFETVTRDGLIYGRGTADNKGQHLINLLALKAVLDVQGRLGFNVKFLLEMGEETGSPGLFGFCQTHKDTLKADVLISSDGPRLDIDTPTVFLGSRGALNFGLSVDLRPQALHSGNWGGLIADPAIRLTQALATLTDARGQLQIVSWRPTSLTPEVRAMIDLLPDADTQESIIDVNWGERDLSPNERVFGWNSFAILAMKSGVPEAPVNAISGSAQATCQLRYVVGTDTDAILPDLRQHLDHLGFEDVIISQENQVAFKATRQDANNIWVQKVVSSLEKGAGRPVHLLPNLAGSLPNECFTQALGLTTIWIPHSYRQCSQHAPNEHMPERLFFSALTLMAKLFSDLGSENS